jgi:hypothetical protein
MASSFTYRSGPEERIEIGYLRRASPEATAQWLKENWKEPQATNSGWQTDTDGRKLIEFILSKRRDSLIDYALARYGYTKDAIQRAYDRGDASTRYAAVANPRGNIALRQSADILRNGNMSLMEALVQCKFLPGKFFEDIFRRSGPFAEIGDQRFLAILHRIEGSPRLSRPYDDTFFDGDAEYMYHRAFQAAWDLTRTVPADQRWATALWGLLENCKRPQGGRFAKIDETLERWRIDPPFVGEPQWWKRSPSFHVRVLLAGFLNAEESLLNADDPALRASFYRRFLPSKFKNWPSFFDMDGCEFVQAVLRNTSIWRNVSERARLEQVCWDCPDPDGNMDAPNDFKADELRYRESNPHWFANEAERASTLQDIKEIKENLYSLIELLGKTVPEGDALPS